LDFRKLWSTITPDLSRKWLVASLQRSSYSPKHVDIRIGPLKKPRNRFLSRPRNRSAQQPLTALPSEATEAVLCHVSHTEHLSLKGDTVDVIRILTSLGESISLTSLSLGFWDESKYHFGGEDEQKGVSLILPESLFGGSAPRLRRLYCHSGLHLTFPSWVLQGVSEFTVSLSFCAERLFSALSHMPQLEALRVQRISFIPQSDAVAVPVNLKNLTLLVIEDTSLEFLLAVLSCISMPANVRKHLKLTLNGCKFRNYPWENFTSLMRELAAGSPDPLHGIHLRSEPECTSICAWVSPTQPGVSPSPWPPLDDSFRLEIRTVASCCLQDSHIISDATISSLHRLQEFCVSVGGQTVQELYVESRKESNDDDHPIIWCPCWRSLFSKFSSLKTLHLGDGAEGLLVSACYGLFADPWSIADGPTSPDFLFGNLQRVIVSRNTFSTRSLWNWIHYAFARPAEWDFSDLRKDVQALLLANRRKSVESGFVEDVIEGLLLFLLCFRSVVVHMFEVSLVESSWDNPGGLETLQRLLHMLDPDWNVILEATISPD